MSELPVGGIGGNSSAQDTGPSGDVTSRNPAARVEMGVAHLTTLERAHGEDYAVEAMLAKHPNTLKALLDSEMAAEQLLNRFMQGYVAALLRSLDEQRLSRYRNMRGLPVPVAPAFSWLAPETLARIIEDCDRFCGSSVGGLNPITANDRQSGIEFWLARQTGRLTASARFHCFPALLVFVRKDEKVYLTEPPPSEASPPDGEEK